MHPLSKAEKLARRYRRLPLAELRPKTRGDCQQSCRPCVWVGCSYNLYLDVTRSGSIHLNFPHLEPGQMTASCALDIADQGGATLEEVGALYNVTMEKARQDEKEAIHGVAVAVLLGYGAGWKRPGAKLDNGPRRRRRQPSDEGEPIASVSQVAPRH